MKTFLLLMALAGAARGWELALEYVESGGPIPDERRILVLGREIRLRQVTATDSAGMFATDTSYRTARLGFWANRRLRKLAFDPRMADLQYSPADTGIFCEGGVTLVLEANRGLLRRSETCRVEKPPADKALNAWRGRIRETLDRALEKGRPGGREGFEAMAAGMRRRFDDDLKPESAPGSR
jgi:hypothetical protein